MTDFVLDDQLPEREETVALYDSVGWSTYADDPARLMAALRGSFQVLCARDDAGQLVGLARTVSDGSTIVYLQDILVDPSCQRAGVGGALLDEVLRRSEGIRQVVLLTDTEPRQRAFYESRGFTEAHDFEPAPLRSFARFA